MLTDACTNSAVLYVGIQWQPLMSVSGVLPLANAHRPLADSVEEATSQRPRR
jgi:hypothetical protein